MSKATNQLIQEQVTEARKNIGITTIFTVGVSEYDHMRRLSGPTLDLESIRRCFIENSDTSLYGEQQLIEIADPTSDELRTQVTEFAENRRARGDIVIFYFSGHGGVLAGGKFLLCTKDTRVSQSLDGGGLLSTSAVLFQDIVHTFSSVDCRPIFIIDACFSGTSALEQGFQIGQMVQNEAYSFGNSYALLCYILVWSDNDRESMCSKQICDRIHNKMEACMLSGRKSKVNNCWLQAGQSIKNREI